jgi:diketogulonate reductase-like aldo/keto reductase
MNHIDTAEMYADGGAEELVGRGIAGMRHEAFLTTKVLPSNASFSGTLRACERSLKRLKTDWIDLYLLHWWSGRHPIAETMRAMQELVVAGKIRFIGVSNLDGDQLQQAESALTGGRLICSQVCYRLKARGIEFSLIPYCRERNMAVVAYSPFGSDNFIPDRTRGGQVLAQIGARHGKSSRQVALNFLTRMNGVFTIPKASNSDHVRENAEAVGWQLTPEDLAAIDHAFPPPAHEVPLEII